MKEGAGLSLVCLILLIVCFPGYTLKCLLLILGILAFSFYFLGIPMFFVELEKKLEEEFILWKCICLVIGLLIYVISIIYLFGIFIL
ncbi:MAG: hypothetical protein Q4G05_00655 [Clostridia bacterium]|nr:hypothetical protein [Clostridia bacterium]